MSRLRVAILSIEPQDSAAWFVRVLTPLAALTDRIEPLLAAAREGTRVSIDPSAIQAADRVPVQRLFPTRAISPFFRRAGSGRRPALNSKTKCDSS